jgi:hypothetical protein
METKKIIIGNIQTNVYYVFDSKNNETYRFLDSLAAQLKEEEIKRESKEKV